MLVAVENLWWAGHDVTDRGSNEEGESADVMDMLSKSGSRYGLVVLMKVTNKSSVN